MSHDDHPTSTVNAVEEHEAKDRVAEIFADIKATKNLDFVPRFWRVIATNPVQLDLVWTTLKTLMHPEAVGRTAKLDAATREMVALAVSATNACPYCINSHTAALRKLGIDEEALGEVMAIAGLFNMTNALASGYQIEPDVRPPH
ncbi:MAG: carboxymuconolactone decarboxylase family protein [Paludisphaera borealis]|uniref:carboxymuconolactone decarboxylase family protein n=1 Tax=Paludisphaera borealis TaxID=1387353 RepID=UPI002849A52B|nr:carboxymuconolactone decarboxylase family protein [Paludisphaera borealis]MDR3619322.1 carboxymuconolactone decarboxylase family protein [Paludisphaera borealis]